MLVVIYFLVLLFFFFKLKKENTIRRWVFGLYTFSAFLSVLYPFFMPVNYDQDVLAYVYYTICTLCLLYPIWYMGNKNCSNFIFPAKFINWTSYVLILFGIIAMVNILPQIFTLRTFLNNMSEVRDAYYKGDPLAETDKSFIFIVANWVTYIQFFSPIFAFLKFIQKDKIIAYLLCVVSLVPAFDKLLIGEREASVVVLSNFVFAYLFFKPILSNEIVSKVRKIGLCIISPFAVFIIAMSIARFGDSDGGTFGGLLAYGGEQPYNFSYFFSKIRIDQQYIGGKLSFGYLFPLNEQLDGKINDYIQAGEYLNVFAGIPGTFLLDFGYFAIFVVLIMTISFLLIFKQKPNKVTKKSNFSTFMAFLIYYQIVFMGIFYYDFTTKYVVIMCFILFIVYYFIQIIYKTKKTNKISFQCPH